MHGVKQFNMATKEMEVKVAKATTGALRANQNLIKTNVRRNLRNPPRWTQRGHSPKYGTPAFKVSDKQENNPRSGGPGRLTGDLYEGIRSKRTPRIDAKGQVSGWVGVRNRVNNPFKARLEQKYPYFAPAVETSAPLMRETYAKGWTKSMSKTGGIL